MDAIKIAKVELKNRISSIPDEKFKKVSESINSIIANSETMPKQPISLTGIWKGKGFEKLADLQSEIKKVRKEVQNSILQRKI